MRYDYLLNLFVSADSIRPALKYPFQQEQFMIATDAHAMVVIDKNLCKKEYVNEHKAPNALKIFNDVVRNCSETISIDRLFSAELHFDVTYSYMDCDKCNGDGVIECTECGHEYECKACDGEGQIKIPGNRCRKKVSCGRNYITIGEATFHPAGVDTLLNAMFVLGLNECQHIANHRNSSNIFKLNDHCHVLLMPIAQKGDPE